LIGASNKNNGERASLNATHFFQDYQLRTYFSDSCQRTLRTTRYVLRERCQWNESEHSVALVEGCQ